MSSQVQFKPRTFTELTKHKHLTGVWKASQVLEALLRLDYRPKDIQTNSPPAYATLTNICKSSPLTLQWNNAKASGKVECLYFVHLLFIIMILSCSFEGCGGGVCHSISEGIESPLP